MRKQESVNIKRKRYKIIFKQIVLWLIIFCVFGQGQSSLFLNNVHVRRKLTYTLAPEINVNISMFQEQFILYMSKQDLGKKFTYQPQKRRRNRGSFSFNKFIERKRNEFSLFLILKLNSSLIRIRTFRNLAVLRNDAVFRFLRVVGLNDSKRQKEKSKQRAMDALLAIHRLNPVLSEKLGLKKRLFAIIHQDRGAFRNRAFALLDQLGMDSDSDLDQLIEWLGSSSWFLISKAALQILKLDEDALEKIKEKDAVVSLKESLGRASITKPVFGAVIEAMRKLNADNSEIAKAAQQCFFNFKSSSEAKKTAELILAQTAEDKRKASRLFVRLGLNDKQLMVRLGAIEALGILGDMQSVSDLREHERAIEAQLKQKDISFKRQLKHIQEIEMIRKTVQQIEKGKILSLYNNMGRVHAQSMHELFLSMEKILDLNEQDKITMEGAIVKFNLVRQLNRADVFDFLLNKYGVRVSSEEKVLINCICYPDKMLSNPDFLKLPLKRREQLRQLAECILIFDRLYFMTDNALLVNWFFPRKLQAKALSREIYSYYQSRFKYTFDLDVRVFVQQLLVFSRSRECLNKRYKVDPQLMADVVVSWMRGKDEKRVLEAIIQTVGFKHIKEAQGVIDVLISQEFENALIKANKGNYQKTKEDISQLTAFLLSNKNMGKNLCKYIKEKAGQKYFSLFYTAVQQNTGFSFFQLIAWRRASAGIFLLKDGTKVTIKILNKKIARMYAEEIIALHNRNNPKNKLTSKRLLEDRIYKENNSGNYLESKWKHSLIAFNDKGKVVGFALNYERRKEDYPECGENQDSLCICADTASAYQNKGLGTLLILNSIERFAVTGFNVLNAQTDLIIVMQTRRDNEKMKFILENKLGFTLSGIKAYNKDRRDNIYSLRLKKKNNDRVTGVKILQYMRGLFVNKHKVNNLFEQSV